MFRARNWLLKKILTEDIKAASLLASGILLDIGCGDKPYESVLRPKVKSYFGLDIPSAIPRANEKKRYHSIDVYASGIALPIRAEAVDTVVCFQVLEHVPEPQLLVSEASRILRPGGRLILSAPHQWQLHEEPFDFYRFTLHGLRYMVEKSGISVNYIKPQGGFWAMLGQKLAYYIGSILPSTGARGYLAESLCNVMLVFADMLDRHQPIPQETMNYLLVAEKCSARSRTGTGENRTHQPFPPRI